MCLARRILTISFACAVAALALIARPADAAQADAKPQKAQRRAAAAADADRPGPAERPAVMLQRMKQQILAMDLSADQKKQIEELFAKAQDELATNRRQNGAGEPAKFRDRAQAIVRDLRQKVDNLLSSEQQQALRRNFQVAQQTVVAGGEQIAERVKNALKSIELTDEQKRKLDAVVAESQRKAKELQDRTQSQMRELMQETRAKVEALLTDEQRQKMNDARPGRPPQGDNGARPKPKAANAPDDRL